MDEGRDLYSSGRAVEYLLEANSMFRLIFHYHWTAFISQGKKSLRGEIRKIISCLNTVGINWPIVVSDNTKVGLEVCLPKQVNTN